MSGNIYDDKAYAGVASYLVTGAGDITSKTNNFYVATDATNTARVDRSTTSTSESDSGIGAPVGPFKVCIGKYDDSAADKCGAARVYEAGEYKFSIFGHIFDTVDFTGYDHVGFRMKVCCFVFPFFLFSRFLICFSFSFLLFPIVSFDLSCSFNP